MSCSHAVRGWMWAVDNTLHVGDVCDSWSKVIGFINSSLKQSQNGWNFSQDAGAG